MKNFLEHSKKIDITLAFIVLFYFFYVFFQYTINIPVNDDYDVIGNFNSIINANTFTEKLQLFYSQHNEHRIVYDKLWFYVSYWFSDTGLNFNFLSFVGNLSLVVLVVFYYFKLKRNFGAYFILFPIAVLVLNLTFWENLTFSMAGLCNFAFLVFAVISLHYLTKTDAKNKDIFLSILFFMLSLLTQGGGLFVFPAALFVLFIRKDKMLFVKYLVLAVLVMFVYFINYHKYPTPSISEIAGNALGHLKFFLAFLGNAVANYHFFPDNNDQAILRSLILGILLFALYVYLFIRKYYNRNLFNFSVMTLIMIISAVTSVTRLSQGMSSAVSSRYRLISVLLLISMFICLLEFFKSKNYNKMYANGLILIVSTAYLFYFNFNGTNQSLMIFRMNASNIGALFYLSGDNSLINCSKPEFCASVLDQSKESKTYILDKGMIDNYYKFASVVDLKEIKDDTSINGSANVVRVNKLDNSYYIDGYAFFEGSDTKNQSVYIILLGKDGQQKVLAAQNEFRPGLSAFFSAPNVDYGGFYIRIKKEDVFSGENKVYVLMKNNEKSKIIKTDKSVIKE
jgi:hypothetical protein